MHAIDFQYVCEMLSVLCEHQKKIVLNVVELDDEKKNADINR